jgi:hypothetical protein
MTSQTSSAAEGILLLQLANQISAHPHYTPTHASWLNQVELFFSIPARWLLKGGEFASVTELVDRIMAFIAEDNRTATPCRWTYDGRPLQHAGAGRGARVAAPTCPRIT